MIRYQDHSRQLFLSVRDLAEEGGASGHLLAVPQISRQRRLEAGRQVHSDYQSARSQQDPSFRAEVPLRHQLIVAGWTVEISGRLDGLSEEHGRTVVVEVKSSALGQRRLAGSRAEDWPSHVAQIEVYLWMLHRARYPEPVGQLVLISLADGSRTVLGVPLEAERIDRFVRRQLERLIALREDRLAWLATRRGRRVPAPYERWRPGQEAIAAAVTRGVLDDQLDSVLVEAPTGLGKTDAVLYGALRAALATDRQILWATARTTQQTVIEAAVQRMIDRGLPLRAVTLTAREKICLNDVVSCRPDACRFALSYHDKVHESELWRRVLEEPAGATRCTELGQRHECCPYQLAVDATERVDVVIADYNYAFDPQARLRRLFADEERAAGWVVVVDEAHQLVERARGYLSPRVSRGEARSARRWLSARGARYRPFSRLCQEVEALVEEEAAQAEGPGRGREAQCELSPRAWRQLADRIDELALDYAILRATEGEQGLVLRGGQLAGDGVLPIRPASREAQAPGPTRPADPWRDVAGTVLRLAEVLERTDPGLVGLAGRRSRDLYVGMLCLDPSSYLRPRIARLGALVAASATLSPPSFYQDLLGLDAERSERVVVGSPFHPSNRCILVAPGVSTTYRDRPRDAPATAALIEELAGVVPGNLAVYFPSFAMLQDISSRWELPGRELLIQERGMPEARRRAWLDRLGAGGRPVLLAAALGGVFAEGIDLPPGALEAIAVIGPALPPVGLERDLLRRHYGRRYGEGFTYASLVPGMTRVVQAAGRLHRRASDRGVIVLVGRRFRQPTYANILPADWAVERPRDPIATVRAFFAAAPPEE